MTKKFSEFAHTANDMVEEARGSMYAVMINKPIRRDTAKTSVTSRPIEQSEAHAYYFFLQTDQVEFQLGKITHLLHEIFAKAAYNRNQKFVPEEEMKAKELQQEIDKYVKRVAQREFPDMIGRMNSVLARTCDEIAAQVNKKYGKDVEHISQIMENLIKAKGRNKR